MNNYEPFLQLHHQPIPLVIANAWNVKSAQLIEKSGYAAIVTSSGAIAESLGYADGEKIPFSELLYIIKRIVSSVTIPVSVDMERGYSKDLSEINENVQQLIDLGVAGINLEDAEGEEVYLKKLDGLSNYLARTNQHLFINARTDAFLQKLDQPLEKTLKRAKLYKEAGANGLFVTAVQDHEIIKAITSAVTLPVNIVGVPKLSSLQELTECGVKRISMAVLLYKATYNHLENMIKEIKAGHSFAPLYKQ